MHSVCPRRITERDVQGPRSQCVASAVRVGSLPLWTCNHELIIKKSLLERNSTIQHMRLVLICIPNKTENVVEFVPDVIVEEPVAILACRKVPRTIFYETVSIYKLKTKPENVEHWRSVP